MPPCSLNGTVADLLATPTAADRITLDTQIQAPGARHKEPCSSHQARSARHQRPPAKREPTGMRHLAPRALEEPCGYGLDSVFVHRCAET